MELVDDAMIGFSTVVAAIIKVDAPELKRNVSLLQQLVKETAPNFPELITIPTLRDILGVPQFSIQSIAFYDLADLLITTADL